MSALILGGGGHIHPITQQPFLMLPTDGAPAPYGAPPPRPSRTPTKQTRKRTQRSQPQAQGLSPLSLSSPDSWSREPPGTGASLTFTGSKGLSHPRLQERASQG